MISDDSGVKFFDRKFVAANLRSQLCCPKCSREYSHKFSNARGAENYRPFLLPCGHNMCEYCLTKDRQHKDLKCAVCNIAAPPTINAKNPNAKGNLRDYYELNYHVIGETNSLDYYRRYSEESINKSLTSSSLSDIVVESKCSECSHMAAMGECEQCNAYYCKRCFETVHHHSRVLKTHVLQRLEDRQLLNKGQNAGIRVGKDIFRLPIKQLCRTHNLLANIFCHICKRIHCEKCGTVQHVGHKTSSLRKMNYPYASEIPGCLNSLEAALSQINNSQLLVKNTKQSLNDFAADTLANINQRFSLLHGNLQNAELRIIEKLRESSLPPQIRLNETMSQLNGYEALLKRLREMLLSGSNDRIDVPQDFWLKEFIRNHYENLEKIPTYVNVTKLHTNPYHFSSNMENILQMIERSISCTFVDPNIKIRLKHEFNNQSNEQEAFGGIPWPNQSRKNRQKMQTDSAKGQIQKRRAAMANNSSSSSNSLNVALNKHNERQSSLLGTFSAMDISKSNVSVSVSSTPASHVGDWFKTNATVRVLSIQSPEDFYVQCLHAAQFIREHLEAVADTPACLDAGLIVVGQHYITHHNRSEVDRWHRAMVSQKAEKRDTYHVFLPDVGLTQQVHSSNFRRLPMELAMLPYAAVHCSLKQLMPSKGGPEWEPQASAFLKQVVQNNPVHLTVVRALSPQLYEVDLITNCFEHNISVSESFLYTGMARSRNGFAPAHVPKPLQLTALQSQILPKYEPHMGDVLKIQMLHIEHPHEFYVMPHDLEHKRQTMQNELQRVMDRMGLACLEPIYLGRLLLGCALQWDGHWQRASIEQMLPDGYVLVRLVDSGISQKVYWDQLFVLPQQFWSQEVAIKCCLADVEALQVHGYAWTPAAIAAFKQLTSNPKLQMQVIATRDRVAHVSLHFHRSGGEINTNVAAILIAQSHCRSSGESSQVMQPRSTRTQLDADTRKLIEESKEEPSEPAKTDKIQRSAIEILYVHHPNEFYVTLTHFASAIVSLRKTVQDTAAEMHHRYPPKRDWQPGDMCFVRVQAESDQEVLWHRGQIIDVTENDELKYNVHLRDIGELTLDVPLTCMAQTEEDLMRTTSSALRCQLYGIKPKDFEWQPEGIKFFKAQLNAYSSLHVNGHGKDGDSLRVTLWGTHTEISGPFSPARTKHVNINETLVLAGWAVKDQQEQQEELASNNTSMSSLDTDDENLRASLDKVDKISSAAHLQGELLQQIGFRHNSDMPPLRLLKDFNATTRTTGCTKPPSAWLQPRKCNKSIFTALPTYVNYQCEVYLSLASDKEFNNHARDLLTQNFVPMLECQELSTYLVGQPVVVVYHMDELLYRGIVKSTLSDKGEHKVYYVDYGNEEMVKPSEMLPYAPFPELNAMCWPVVIHGIQPNLDDTMNMDSVHQMVVSKLSGIRVVEAKGPNGLPACNIKVGDVDIATMMVTNGMATRRPLHKEMLESKQQRQDVLKSFKIFDELLQLAEMQSPVVVVDQNNTTAQPPPAKKKLMMDSKELEQLDCEEDFDCMQAAVQQLQTSVDFDNDAVDGFSDDYIIEEIDEGIANEDHTTPSPEPDEASFMPPQGISTMDQLRRRIQLRQKERLESSHFSPLNTSTERSYHDGTDFFKPQILPTGVKQFQCSIDKVLSATELQISPQLTEFAKHEIALAHETSALIRHAPRLYPVQEDVVCLARYTLDKQWYRAIVKELHLYAEQATVFYIDFQDTEMVPFADLKVMPKQLFMFPQRSFRVKLHGIKMNRNFGETSVRHSLQACLCKYPVVFACVHYPINYHANNDNYCGSELCSSSESIRNEYCLLEVDIYKNNTKTELLYKPLIDSSMFLLK